MPLTGDQVVWCDPPPPGSHTRGTRRAWAAIAYQLREQPNRWALICDQDGNLTLGHRITHGHAWWAPAGAYQTTTRMIEGRLHIWARYVGDPRGRRQALHPYG